MVKIACHVEPRAQEDWPLEKTEEAPRRQQEAKLRGPIRRGTMSFGKGEFLSVQKVHKIKIAVARSVTAVRRLEVGCPVKEVFCDAYGIFQKSKYTWWMLDGATL